MHPILFELGSIKIYSYGFLIAVGAIAGIAYLSIQGKKEVGLTFDQANLLFLWIFIAAVVGGKVFLFFEDPAAYINHPAKLFKGNGFVFYGSFLFAVPTMFWFFKRYHLHTYKMLDVMAIVTCLVHMFGRLGCFLAGCCYGHPTDSWAGIIFDDPACYAQPKDVPLHPTQLYEASYIFLVMVVLFIIRDRRKFYGQLFLLYLGFYAIGRSIIEFFRGDEIRGYVFGVITHSQLIALSILIAVVIVYKHWAVKNLIIPASIKNKRA
jgi:phosphatidylglycerol---prolipoprotein diacylglyceryl transferase